MRARATLIVAGAILTACGLDIVGAASPTPDASTEDAATGEDASRHDDAAHVGDSAPSDDAGTQDSGPQAPVVLVTDEFDADLNNWTIYGGVTHPTLNNNGFASLVPQGADHRAAGMFFVPPDGTKAFEAVYDIFIDPDGASAADGMTLTWLTSTLPTPLGTGAKDGRGLGIMPGAAGYSFALDTWKNNQTGDDDPPTFAFLEIDAALAPGEYDWHIAQDAADPTNLYDEWRTIRVVVAEGKASAWIDTPGGSSETPIFTDVTVDTSADIVAIGFTASTGNTKAAFAVDNVTISAPAATAE